MCEIPKDFPTIIASEERFILPSSELSNSADELEVVHLPGYDLWMTFIKNIHVIPTQLNVEKFCSALSKTMSMYLHTSGRLEHSVREGWAIKMTHSAVPLSIRVTSDLTCYQNRSECVVRDDLGFLHAPRPDRLLVESGQAPLLLVAITIAQEESAIAISWHHTLGDANICLRFVGTLSKVYQGIETPYPYPTFDKQNFSFPTPEIMENYLPLMPHLVPTAPTIGLGKENHVEPTITWDSIPTAQINWHVAKSKLSLLRAGIQADVHILKISIQDCISAYVATLINRHKAMSIQKITNAASYRNIQASFVHPDVAGNEILIIPTEETSIQADVSSISKWAATIRRSINRSLTPQFIESWISLASHLMLEAAETREGPNFDNETNTMTVNSNLSLPWQSANFGCGSGSRFFTSGISRYYLRVFPSNHGEEAVDIAFGVPQDIETKIIQSIEADFTHPSFPSNLIKENCNTVISDKLRN